MPLTYFKCVDTLLAYYNKSIPEEPSLWFAFGLYRRTNKLKFSTTIADKIGFKKLDRIRLIILFVKSNYIK